MRLSKEYSNADYRMLLAIVAIAVVARIPSLSQILLSDHQTVYENLA
ncbi:hypothetical protein [Microcoleus sp. FACHB-68]|nr:hypothetical protein [Microcoleus sp. FACHB-68]MBD1938212.1 hypothetical protein [Microcoleus sp. FACHB-68]